MPEAPPPTADSPGHEVDRARLGEPVRRVWRDVLAPRGWRVDVPIFVLALALGLGVALSVKAQRAGAGLAADRPDELVSILAALGTRNDQLQQSVSQLQTESRALQTGGSAAALQEAQQRTAELGILAGTVAAHGPGVVVTVTDPGRTVGADVIVDEVEELRDAGAEALDLSGVRVVAQTYVVAAPGGGLVVDGTTLLQPYRLTAIGDPPTLAAALGIPGGVQDEVTAAGGGARAAVVQAAEVRITSLRLTSTPRYARPDPSSTKDGP